MIVSDFTDLSTDEIKALIQQEVDKGPDKLDTDYIDLCFELLSIKNKNSNKKRIKFTKPTKVLLAAALFVVVFVVIIFFVWLVRIVLGVNGNPQSKKS